MLPGQLRSTPVAHTDKLEGKIRVSSHLWAGNRNVKLDLTMYSNEQGHPPTDAGQISICKNSGNTAEHWIK